MKRKAIRLRKRNKATSPKEKVNRFVIKKVDDLKYDPKINYYIEYWKMYYENEYILAKIKEASFEINLMKEHLNNFKNQT